DSMLPAEVRRLHSGLMLLQNPNDLLFRVSALLHRSPLSQITGELQFSLAEFFGSRSPPPRFSDGERAAVAEGALGTFPLPSCSPRAGKRVEVESLVSLNESRNAELQGDELSPAFAKTQSCC